MGEIHRLTDVEAAERAASAWIARLGADDVSAEDRMRFEAWRNASPRHARAYEDLCATWRRLTEAGPMVRAVSFGQSMNEAANFRRTPQRWGLAAAAAIGAVALAGWWYAARLAPETRFQTAIGEHASVALPDGSTLELNSNSFARLDYTESARIVRLERGEAYFTVTRDQQRPFRVVAGGSWVQAVGTAFNVYVRPAGVRVTVSEGTVKVGHDDSAGSGVPSARATTAAPVSILNAGQQLDVHGQAARIRSLPPAELTRSVAWRNGTLYFENQPLGDVAAELSRYTTLKIVVNDEILRNLPVGGTFQANPQGAETLLTMLEDGFGLSVDRGSGDRVYIEAPRSRIQE